MKQYSRSTAIRSHEDWTDTITFMDDNPDSELFTVFEQEYMRKYYNYAVKMAKYKNKEYAAVGIMDQNDLEQEAHLAYLEALRAKDNADFSEVVKEEKNATEWSYINNSAKLNFAKSIRKVKDGIRVPERELFRDKDTYKDNILTQYFPDLEVIFEEIQEPKWDKWKQLVYMDVAKWCIKKVCVKKEHAVVLRAFFGIGYNKAHKQKTIARALGISVSNVETIKSRLMKELKSDVVKQAIVDTIQFNDAPLTPEGWKFFKKLSNSCEETEKAWLINHVGSIEKQKVDAYKKLGFDVTDRNSYALHAYRVHGSKPKAEELFSDRSSALKSLLDIESDATLRVDNSYDHDFYRYKGNIKHNNQNDYEEAE